MIDKEPDQIVIADDLTELAMEARQRRIDDILNKGGRYDEKTKTYSLHGQSYDADGRLL